MRLILILVIGWGAPALPALADYHDYGGYDAGDGYDEVYDGTDADGDYREPQYQDPQAGAVQTYDCAEWVQGQCVPFESEGQRIRE